MSAIEVNTTRYEFSHGKQPRGYGWWAFDIIRYHGDGTRTRERVMRAGKYGEAKRYAVTLARTGPAATIVVLP
ncbi:MAG: hypothetical protein JXA90_13530 [Planctomycetes bacterium]|nr:hypothetical protein [Planctomycetota bacterium]